MSDTQPFHPLTWEHYGILLDDLWKDLQAKLSKNNVTIDAVIAILREGIFTAVPLSYRLNTYKILTIQYKYMLYEGGNELRYISGLQDIEYDLPDKPVFLLCDTFPCGGKTKLLAAEKVKEKYPKVRFVFASLVQDRSVDNNPDFLFSAYAFDINDKWETTHPLFKELGIEKRALEVVLPWENAKEEMAAVNEKEWIYD